MLPVILALTLIAQPGLAKGIIPGMSEDQVESILGERGGPTFNIGPFFTKWITFYHKSNVMIEYDHGSVSKCHYQP
jgi:hypothetical protein